MTYLSIFSRLHQLCSFTLLVFLLATITLAQSTIRTQQQATQLAQAFLAKEQANPPTAALDAKRTSLMLQKRTTLNVGKLELFKDDHGSLVAYIQHLTPEGFIIVPAFARMRPVLAFSLTRKLSTDDPASKPLLDMVLSDINLRNELTSPKQEMLNQSVQTTQWGPWLQTHWYQSGHFNNKCPYSIQGVPLTRRPAGCVAIATGQIVDYWQYPSSISFSPNRDTYSANGIDFFDDASSYGFPSISELNSALASISYANSDEEESNLIFGIGVKVRMSYGVGGSAAYSNKVASALKAELNYGSAVYKLGELVWPQYRDDVIRNIKDGWPVYLGIAKHWLPLMGAHAVVVDGYREPDGYFHVNVGWELPSIWNVWYDLPNIAGYSLISEIILDIAKYQGWNQYGADERKTFRTPYGAPEKPVIREEWHVTCASDYSFTGLIVGDGERIVASCSPNNQNQGDPSSVWFIDQYGTKLGDIVLQNEDENLTVPVQSPEGDIYVGTGKGGIYKIDARARTATRVFQEGSKEQFFNPPTVDQDGNIYFSTFHTLYCLSSSGSERWHFTAPNGGVIGRGCAAVDPARGFVFIAHYNPTTKTPYLRCINRTNGTKVAEKTFPTVNSASRSAGIASLDADGTIYVGSNTTLYALSPDASLSEKWSRPFSSGMSDNAPVIGRNGRLYVGHWVGSSGNRTLQLSALDARNGNTLWSVSYPNLGDYDNLLQPYVAANDVILFTFLFQHGSGPSTYELHAYKDNGTSATLLWKKSFNSDGGNLSFGPGSTVYVIPSSGYGHKITAISDGDEGDPEGAGMSYENNQPPGLPSNPFPANTSKDVDTVSVRLSWVCSDPDGHALKYNLFACPLVEGEEAGFIPVATGITENSYTLTGLRHGTQYFWSVVATDGQAIAEGPVWSFTTAGTPTGVETEGAIAAIPEVFELYQNYPNPFNPSTTIQYGLPQKSRVVLDVFDVLGQKVASLLNGTLPAGYHNSQWDATVSSGIYFYRLEAISVVDPSSRFIEVKKMILLR
jgi:hypothetical protein